MASCVSLSANSSGRIVLLGNGVNLVAGKNSHLRYQSVLASYVKDDKLDDEFFNECIKLSPTFVHYALAELHKEVDAYLTTNYDRAMEIALNAKFSEETDNEIVSGDYLEVPLVMHIHGEATKKETCIFFKEDYERALKHIAQEDWYAEFHQKEVHIVGLSLRQEEMVLYHLLKVRRKKIAELSDFKYDASIQPIYAWLTYEEHEKKETLQLAEKLTTLSVVPILIPIYDKDYISAWERILGKFLLHCKKIHVCSAECKALKSAKTPQQYTRGKCISYSSTRSLKYPERVHIKIAKASLRKHASELYWYFYCEIDLRPRIWCVPMADLLQIEASYSLSGHIHLYLDYSTGELYAKKQLNDACAEKVLLCMEKTSI